MFCSPSHSTVMTSTSSFPSVWQEIGNNKAQITGKPIFHPTSILSRQSVLKTAPSISGSGPLPTLPAPSLTPYQLSQSGAEVLSSTKKLCVDARNLGASTHIASNSSISIAAVEHQTPSFPSLREMPAQQVFTFIKFSKLFFSYNYFLVVHIIWSIYFV